MAIIAGTVSTFEKQAQQTRVLMAVSRSMIKGYPHASISSTRAFEFLLKKIASTDASRFKILLLHVEEPDDCDTCHERGLMMLSCFEKRCRDKGVACEYWIKKGYPEREIGEEVKRVQPDLLVVGSRALGWFQRIFIRSVSDTCAKSVECPILIVKRRPEDSPGHSADD